MGKVQKKKEVYLKTKKTTNVIKKISKKNLMDKKTTSVKSSKNEKTAEVARKLQTRSAVEAVLKLDKKSTSKSLFDERVPILMQIVCIKVPKCPRRILRLKLKHSLYSDSDVCLIVPDLKRGRRIDFEPTVEHYQNLLREKEIENIKRIIPMNQIKTEYDQFELKRRLVGQYDAFLVDGKIAGHVSHLLGKVFYDKRKLPTPIKLNKQNLKDEIDEALRKTSLPLHSTGDTFITQVGHTKMSRLEIEENIEAVMGCLKQIPGGTRNIRAVHLKTHNSLSVPLYISLKGKNSIKCPIVKPKLVKNSQKVIGELSTMAESDVCVLPSGLVHIIKNDK